LTEHLSSLAEPVEAEAEEVIEVIRNSRAVAERFERLVLEAEQQIEGFCKPPFFNRNRNPSEEKVLRRGVRVRALYEKAALDDPAVKPYFADWIKDGEEARIYDGELPHKLQIFDSKIVLMPLIRPGEQTKTVLIRHPQLAQSLSLAFEYLWERSKPVTAARETPIAKTTKPVAPKRSQRLGANSSRSHHVKK